MSLLVKDLGMPDNCTECLFASKYDMAYNHKKNVWEPLKMIIEEEK